MTDTNQENGAILTPYRILVGYILRDQAFLRVLYPNFHKVDDDLYRSGHPTVRQLRKAHARGIRSILSLRGEADTTPNLVERKVAQELGLEIGYVRLRAMSFAPPHSLLELLQLFRELPKPILVHCRSGADRTGFAVTLYKHLIKGIPLDEARKALSWRYGHLPLGNANRVHHFLDAFDEAHRATGIAFEDWLMNGYDMRAIMRRSDRPK